jgi:hypothetical protein
MINQILHRGLKINLTIAKYDWYVFNSHWTYEKYRMMFDIPTERSLVIKNGIADIKPRDL